MIELQIFVPLMVAAIQSAGQVLSSVASKVKDVANKHIFDKTFVENIISDSNHQLADLLKAAASDIKQEIREQGIIDVIQELQADITVLGKLLDLVNTSELSPAIAERLIPNALIPLQKSLEKARLRLKQHGKDDIGSYCHVVGTSTLIAGYAYLGQNMPTLQKELESSIYKFQKYLLDEIAQRTIRANKEIPWEKIPHLITINGVPELYALYNSTLQIAEKNTNIKSTSNSTKEPTAEIDENPEYGLNMLIRANTSSAEILRVQKLGIEVTACPKCKTLNSLALIECEKCHTNLDKVKPMRNPYL